MHGTTGAPTSSASAPAGRLSPRLPSGSLAGLIDVLDRADGPGAAHGRRRHPVHRTAAARSMPLRSVQPAPMARRPAAAPVIEPGSYWDMSRAPAPAPAVDGDRKPATAPGPRTTLIRRAAMWGAGPHGEHLAWRTAMAPGRPAPHPASGPAPSSAPRPSEAAPWRPRLRNLVRRMALWGAGENGANLAWRPRVAPGPARRLDPPVVLREMPSTPQIQPAATSPAAALLPARPVAARRPIGPVLPRTAVIPPVGWVAPADPGSPAPSGWPAPPAGWPQPPVWPAVTAAAARSMAAPASRTPVPSGGTTSSPSTSPAARSPFSSPRARGLARARGDPLPAPARGSPWSNRRSSRPTPSASIWSPAPASLPPPCPAHSAPG
jgi:hypothetical protein